MIIGYLRVSTRKQVLTNQEDEIRRFIESRNLKVDSWVTEVGSENGKCVTVNLVGCGGL